MGICSLVVLFLNSEVSPTLNNLLSELACSHTRHSFPRCFGPNEDQDLDPEASQKKFEQMAEVIRKESGTEKSLDEIVGFPSHRYTFKIVSDKHRRIRCMVLLKLPMKLWQGRSGPLQKREVSRQRGIF